MMTRQEELQQMLLFAQAIGQGVSFVMTRLLAEHVKMQSEDPEACMIRTREMLDTALLSFWLHVPSREGEDYDISPVIREKVKMILDTIEGEARHALNLAPPVKERH
jgi:hypothetical protein